MTRGTVQYSSDGEVDARPLIPCIGRCCCRACFALVKARDRQPLVYLCGLLYGEHSELVQVRGSAANSSFRGAEALCAKAVMCIVAGLTFDDEQSADGIPISRSCCSLNPVHSFSSLFSSCDFSYDRNRAIVFMSNCRAKELVRIRP